MFYKAIGFVVWKFAIGYVRQRYGRALRVALVAGIASIIAAGYLASRSGDDA